MLLRLLWRLRLSKRRGYVESMSEEQTQRTRAIHARQNAGRPTDIHNKHVNHGSVYTYAVTRPSFFFSWEREDEGRGRRTHCACSLLFFEDVLSRGKGVGEKEHKSLSMSVSVSAEREKNEERGRGGRH